MDFSDIRKKTGIVEEDIAKRLQEQRSRTGRTGDRSRPVSTVPGIPGDLKHEPELLGGLEHGVYFPFHIWDVILPLDFHIFQDG